MKIVTYNIQFTRGLDERFDLPRVARTVEGADIIGMQEVDRHWRRTGNQDQAAALAEHFPGFFWVYGATIDAPVPIANPERASAAERGRRRQHGNLILSRWPILASRVLPLPKAAVEQFCALRVVLEAVIDAPGGALRIWCTHLCHIGPATRVPQVERMIAYARELPEEGAVWSGEQPTDPSWADGDSPPPYPESLILMGDLNFRPDSAEYQRLAEADIGLSDAWRILGRDPGATFHHTNIASEDGTPQRIDHFFVSSDLATRVADGWVDQKAAASDHHPVWLEVR